MEAISENLVNNHEEIEGSAGQDTQEPESKEDESVIEENHNNLPEGFCEDVSSFIIQINQEKY